MIGTLLRLILIVLIVVGIGAFFFGYRWADRDVDVDVDHPVGTTGSDSAVETSRARETGAEIGERVAVGVNEVQEAAMNASLTAKIKSKMGLDDLVDATDIDVDTHGSVVTLSGRVATSAERDRAMQLARETEGVSSVVDNLAVAP